MSIETHLVECDEIPLGADMTNRNPSKNIDKKDQLAS